MKLFSVELFVNIVRPELPAHSLVQLLGKCLTQQKDNVTVPTDSVCLCVCLSLSLSINMCVYVTVSRAYHRNNIRL